jgi:putative Holliday junction resolvase
MKTLALDIGDVWTGSAISDALGMFARPYKTVETKDLIPFLTTTLAQEPISVLLIGYPKTMSGGKSAQTEKVEAVYQQLAALFTTVQLILWDERLSSKRADQLKKNHSKEDKIQSHSRAAAFILSTYLDFKHLQKID